MADKKTYVGAAVFFDRTDNDGFSDGDDILPIRTDDGGPTTTRTEERNWGIKRFSASYLFKFLSRVRKRV